MYENWDELAREPEGQAALNQAPRAWGSLPKNPTPPALDLSLLPPALRDMAAAVADSVGASRDIAAVIGLGVGSACITGRVFVQLKPDWKEPGWAFLLVVAKPGDGKSPCYKHLTSPLFDWQTEQNRARRVQVEQTAALRAMLEAEKQKAIKKGDREAVRLAVQELAEQAQAFEIGRFIKGNTTPEAFVQLMSENGGAVAQLDDEGDLFDLLQGRYQDIPDLSPGLQGYSGGASVELRRRGGSISAEHAAVSVLALTQPIVMENVLTNSRMAGKGFLGRFLACSPEPPDVFVRRKPDIPYGTATAYQKALARLLTLPETVLTLDDAAREVFLDFEQEIFEKRRGEWSALETLGICGKLAGNAARLAAILCAWADEKTVSAARMRDAVALVRWFAEHMLRLYGEQNAVSRQAQEVLTLLQKRGEACILERTLTDTLRKRQGFDKDAFERALCELAARGYIQRDEVKGGGRPTKYIYLHPGLMQERSETL